MTQMNARILSGRTADVFEKLDILEDPQHSSTINKHSETFSISFFPTSV